jgi:hypothetical protein
MSNHNNRLPDRLKTFYFSCEELQCIDIKPCIDFIEENIFRIKETYLKEFEFSLFPSRKSYIEITLKKASFYPPLAKWIRRECAPLVEEALASKRINEFFDTEKLRTMFTLHKEKKQYNLHPLMNVVQLHNWFETVYDA